MIRDSNEGEFKGIQRIQGTFDKIDQNILSMTDITRIIAALLHAFA
jgi:hypothetical protein